MVATGPGLVVGAVATGIVACALRPPGPLERSGPPRPMVQALADDVSRLHAAVDELTRAPSP